MARRRPSRVHGLLVVDKPGATTSHDVVAMARRALNERRIGHAGTLDPDATGVLLLGVGNATRLLRFLTVLPKAYETEIVLGVSTDTLDDSGEVVCTHEMEPKSVDEVRLAASRLTGRLDQIPPMVSAIKVDGKRLHELAREGIEIERKSRPVMVHSFDIEPTDDDQVWKATIVCGSGTYVRVLAADLGEALGGGAHVRRLRRTRSGSFGVDEATSVDSFELRPMLDVMRDYRSVEVDDETASSILNGGFLGERPEGPGPWSIVRPTGELLAVHELNELGRVRPAVVMPKTGGTVLGRGDNP